MNGFYTNNYNSLSHPLLIENCSDISSLVTFQPDLIQKILRNVLVENVDFDCFNFKTKKWFIQCTSYVLRINADNYSDLFDFVLNFYNKLHGRATELIITNGSLDENNYYLIFHSLLHLSQIFDNPIFYTDENRINIFLQNIRNNFLKRGVVWPFKIRRLLIDVILCGTRRLTDGFTPFNDHTSAIKFATLALDLIVKYDCDGQCKDEIDFSYFNPHFESLFKYQFFIDLIMKKLLKLYKAKIFGKNYSRYALDFITSSISNKHIVSRENQNLAFSYIIVSWLIHDSNSKQTFVETVWNSVKDISDNFLEWFDMEGDIFKSDSEWCARESYKKHPLFLLSFKAPDDESRKGIDEKIEHYIEYILSIEKGKETKAYWLFCIHAQEYLLCWNHFNDHIDGLIKYVNNILSNDSIEKMKNDLRYLDEDVNKVIGEVFTSLTSIIGNINKNGRAEDIFGNINKNTTVDTFESIKIVFLLITGNYNLIWEKITCPFKTQAMSSYKNIIPLIMLLIGAGQNILPNNLYNSSKENATIFINWVIDYLTERYFDSSINGLKRILFGLIGIANNTIFFFENKESTRKILEWGKNCPEGENIPKLFEMLRMAIISGGKFAIKEEKESCITQKPNRIFATPHYIISLYDNILHIRHSLGSIVYNIDRNYYASESWEMKQGRRYSKSHSPRKECGDYYEFVVAKSIDNIFFDDCDEEEESDDEWEFTNYSYSEKKNYTEIGNSIFSKLGFFLDNDDKIKYIDTQTDFRDLDNTTVTPQLPVLIFQINDNENPRIGKENTSGSRRLMKSLRNVDNDDVILFSTNLMTINYMFSEAVPYPSETDENNQEPVVIVLNETGRSFNHECPLFSKFNSIIEVVPQDDGFFKVNISYSSNAVNNENFASNRLYYCISDKRLGKLIALLTLVMFTSNCSRVYLSALSNPFFKRQKMIKNIFERNGLGLTSRKTTDLFINSLAQNNYI